MRICSTDMLILIHACDVLTLLLFCSLLARRDTVVDIKHFMSRNKVLWKFTMAQTFLSSIYDDRADKLITICEVAHISLSLSLDEWGQEWIIQAVGMAMIQLILPCLGWMNRAHQYTIICHKGKCFKSGQPKPNFSSFFLPRFFYSALCVENN